MDPAPNLVLVGPMGAGKSSIGRQLAQRLGMEFVDLDGEIERRTGASVSTIFECEGEAGFRARERAALAEILEGTGRVVASGGGAVLDAGNRGLMRERGFVVYLHVSVPVQLERLARDRSRPLLAVDDREAVLQRLSDERGPLYREVAHLRFETGSDPASVACARLAGLLKAQWQRSQPAAAAARGAKSA